MPTLGSLRTRRGCISGPAALAPEARVFLPHPLFHSQPPSGQKQAKIEMSENEGSEWKHFRLWKVRAKASVTLSLDTVFLSPNSQESWCQGYLLPSSVPGQRKGKYWPGLVCRLRDSEVKPAADVCPGPQWVGRRELSRLKEEEHRVLGLIFPEYLEWGRASKSTVSLAVVYCLPRRFRWGEDCWSKKDGDREWSQNVLKELKSPRKRE